MNETNTNQTDESGRNINPVLANVNSKGKRTNECLFCRNRFCYTRVVSLDYTYDEVACTKHIKDLYKHSDLMMPKTVKHFISSTGIVKRGEFFP